MKRPETTLFTLMSADGKISSGDTDEMDFERDLKDIKGVGEGLHQYHDIKRRTDLHTLNTGKMMAKLGVNERTDSPEKSPVSFIIIDSAPHLTLQGVEYLAKWAKTLYIATSNREHPANSLELQNVVILDFSAPIDFSDLFACLLLAYDIKKVTIQSGGTLNSTLIRGGFIDHLSIVVAPVVIGGKTTPTLIDGESIHSQSDLQELKALTLVKTETLKDSYLHLRYDVAK
jgi:2,5-diamino-6-(ribosylamino)-4(3H)-pyrimidinone 5'-phosphate reductase